jgi:hypothetical protein
MVHPRCVKTVNVCKHFRECRQVNLDTNRALVLDSKSALNGKAAAVGGFAQKNCDLNSAYSPVCRLICHQIDLKQQLQDRALQQFQQYFNQHSVLQNLRGIYFEASIFIPYSHHKDGCILLLTGREIVQRVVE